MKNVAPPPRGSYLVWDVDERTGIWMPRFASGNQIQYDWARVAVQCIGLGKSSYKINAVYLEFENLASPGDPVSTPSYDRDEGVEYYLSLTGARDYLRLPLLSQPQLAVDADFADYFTGDGDDVNSMTFFAQSAGASGVNGLDFSQAENSTAIGIALVATPVFADRTRDIVFGRAYFASGKEVAKADGRQIGTSWTQVFG